MKLGPIGGYIVTIGGYGAPLKEHRENTVVDKWDLSFCVAVARHSGLSATSSFTVSAPT